MKVFDSLQPAVTGHHQPKSLTSSGVLTARRILFFGLVGSTFALLIALFASMVLPGGVHWAEAAMLICFGITLPWTVIGFWNATLGLALMRLSKDPVAAVAPYLASGAERVETGEAERAEHAGKRSTAILMCVRNEDARAFTANLSAMADELIARGDAQRYALYVLSDSNQDDKIAEEESAVETLSRQLAAHIPVIYRRRDDNPGFKAGNIEDFCDRWGAQHSFALVLDADSLMAGRTITRMVDLMIANPQIGILQHLTAGRPAQSLFTRVFQFGMRLGMRSYTLGSAWWQGDCGPYWGHNAVLRLAPFMAHCRLPNLPGRGPLSGKILSHDQVEAVLMRRAGFEVRVLPEDDGSWEENPPHLLEFIRRDLRWCQGNLQYFRLLTLPRLPVISRIQLFLAILMFIGSPAWLGLIVLSAVYFSLVDDVFAHLDPFLGGVLTVIVMTMVFAPKFATAVDVLLDRRNRRVFGGTPRIVVGVVGETAFSMLLAPIMASMHTAFIARLCAGYGLTWESQDRKGSALPFAMAWAHLRWPTMVGVAGVVGASAMSWPSGLFLIPVVAGPFLAVPFAVMTSLPSLGGVAQRLRAWQIPEENKPIRAQIVASNAVEPVPGGLQSGQEAEVIVRHALLLPMQQETERPAA